MQCRPLFMCRHTQFMPGGNELFTARRYTAAMDGGAYISRQIDDDMVAPSATSPSRPASPPISASGAHPSLSLISTADASISAVWQGLAAASISANVFAEPWLALPGIIHCDNARSSRLALISKVDGTPIGLAPLVARPRFGRMPLRTIATWSHPNSFLSPAVAAAGEERTVWQNLLANAAAHFPGHQLFFADGLVEGSPLHLGLLDAAAALGLPVAIESRAVRAMLATDLDADAYWDASVRAKKRKELRRQWARLGEVGTLTVDHGDGVTDPAAWIAEFLALEASGWKGANGSALASNADTRAFFTEAMAAGWAQGKVLLTALRIDGHAIAMLITLISGAEGHRAGFSFKTAFDEAFARFSPGVLLQRESLSLLTSRKLAFIDSCAAQDHPMIDSLWRERRTVVSVSMPLPGALNRVLWQAAQAAMQAWRKLKSPSRLREGLGVGLSEGDAGELTGPPVAGDTRPPSPPPASGRGEKDSA